LVSSVGRKALDGDGSLQSGAPSSTIRRSFWSSAELVMAVASSECSRQQAYAYSKEPLTIIRSFGPSIFNLR
jgi:hypothetical protein